MRNEEAWAFWSNPSPKSSWLYGKWNCQDEPHIIATTPEEADELLDLWEQGVIMDRQIK
jgi:hypothetical protein